MKACGIIAEYNPFHNGHWHQLKEARKQTQADVMIVVMSGNFLQRGEPALVDKWVRAEMALASGADLVVELPVSFSVQAADYFAQGGIQLLDALHCFAISFGAESGDGKKFEQAGRKYVENEVRIDEAFHSLALENEPYAKRMEQAIKKVFPRFPLDLSTPNNQLGFAYAKALARLDSSMKIAAVKRKHADYLDEKVADKTSVASATAIRKVLLSGRSLEEVSAFIPEMAKKKLSDQLFVDWEVFWPYLHYQLTVSSVEELRAIYQVEEGLEFRLKQAAVKAVDFSDFLSRAKTKRLTWTRLQRTCIYILLQQTKKQMRVEMQAVKAIHLLGFSKKGQAYLNKKKASFSLPLLTNIHHHNDDLWKMDIRAGEVFCLANGKQIKKQDYTRAPLRNIDIKESR